MSKLLLTLFSFLVIVSISYCIYRDIQIEKQYTGDLRNRVVGSRLQMDNHPPYFYKWKTGDSIRYYDPQNFDTVKIANITATPFFHQLLYPVANLEQRAISRIWLAMEYCMLLGMTFIGLSFAKTMSQKVAVLILSVLFLYTNAWTGHILAAQLYLFIPFLAMLFVYFISKRHNIPYAAFAGACVAILLLIRPNTLIFFLPFLLLANRYSLRYKVVFFISTLLIFFFAFNSNQKISYWKDYRMALAEQLKSHQGLGVTLQQNDADPRFTNWEGWDMKKAEKDAEAFPYNYNKEHGNVFVLVNHAFSTKIPVWSLAITSLLIIAGFFFWFYKKYRHTGLQSLYHLSILAFCLYMVTDIFSPVHRFQYYATQWLFPLLLIAAAYSPRYKRVYIGIIAGLILNSLNLSFMVMEQTLGEFIVFLSILSLLFLYKPEISK